MVWASEEYLGPISTEKQQFWVIYHARVQTSSHSKSDREISPTFVTLMKIYLKVPGPLSGLESVFSLSEFQPFFLFGRGKISNPEGGLKNGIGMGGGGAVNHLWSPKRHVEGVLWGHVFLQWRTPHKSPPGGENPPLTRGCPPIIDQQGGFLEGGATIQLERWRPSSKHH